MWGIVGNSNDQQDLDSLLLSTIYTEWDNAYYLSLLEKRPSCEIETPLDPKRKRLLLAVAHDDLDEVKQRLDSPELYAVTNRATLNLLQIAIIRNSVKVFDFLLSLPDFPLDLINVAEETALTTSLSPALRNDCFAEKLIDAGANINQVDLLGRSILYFSILAGHARIAKLLVQKGANLDSRDYCGDTPLHVACRKGDIEIASFLLSSGADPRNEDVLESRPYDIAVIENNAFLQEILFNYTFDEYYRYEVQWEILLHVARQNPALLDKIEAVVGEVFYYDPSISSHHPNFFALDVPTLVIITKRFGSHVRRFLSVCNFQAWSSSGITLEKIEILRSHGCQNAIIKCIQNTVCGCLIENSLSSGEATLTSVICYLLSYGLEINEENLHQIYAAYGDCDLFRIMLHFDAPRYNEENLKQVYSGHEFIDRPDLVSEYHHPCNWKEIMPCMIYDVTMDVEKFLRASSGYSTFDVHLLLHYFAHPKLNELCLRLYGDGVRRCVLRVPEVPRLVELSRNVFRKHLIQEFGVESSKDFFRLLNGLPIGKANRRIISYETKLYGECEVKWRSLKPLERCNHLVDYDNL